ncbi:MAG: metal ABC transporter substrate-binding protein [Actinomycetota bacterium]
MKTRVAFGLAALVALSACGANDDNTTTNNAGATSEPVKITTSFYPLQYLAERIGGSNVQVTNLTKPGAEPHDLELTASDVAAIQNADLVAYLADFQPAVDEGITTARPAKVFNAADGADLDLTYTPIEEGQEEKEEAGSTDPHFWLDPTRMDAVATALTAKMVEVSPADATLFNESLSKLRAELTTLDAEYTKTLDSCTDRNLVTSHNAFGYLARRYKLQQRGITGLAPEVEPNATNLAGIADFVTEQKVTTIYSEVLVSPAIAETVANETGARLAVLDPIEGLSEESAGKNYFEIMRANLTSLQKGQNCG